jgi:hypothetical protein
VLETLVKADLEQHLAEVGGPPPTQYGFRPGRSCATALGAAHAGWLSSRHPGGREVVGVMGFDLSAAFDTVDKSSLLPKPEAVGVKGLALKWFKDYISGGRQKVVWHGVRSNVPDVKYGVRQGSILGPLLYLVIMADLPAFLGLGRKGNAMYADDLNVWGRGKTRAEVAKKLEKLADKFAVFTKGNGLTLNAAKTQLVYSAEAGNSAGGNVFVDSVEIVPSDSIELLGVRYDRRLTTKPKDVQVDASRRQLASLIACLTHRLPRGPFLR